MLFYSCEIAEIFGTACIKELTPCLHATLLDYVWFIFRRDVMLLMRIVDFEGVQMRKCRTLKRRVY